MPGQSQGPTFEEVTHKESYIPVSQDRFQGRFLYLVILILGMTIIDPLVENFAHLRSPGLDNISGELLTKLSD